MSDRYPFRVKRAGRNHAAFVYAEDARLFIKSEACRRDFDPDDFTIEDATTGRKVVGVTNHGAAILETLEALRV